MSAPTQQPEASGVFDAGFLIGISGFVKMHHALYVNVPPQGIYFESLVEQAFRRIKKPFTIISTSNRNTPGHDLLVEEKKISLKTETGVGTDAEKISITKLCTTEKEPWDAPTLIGRVIEHLARYDIILMLRAVWDLPLIHYQLLEIPINHLTLIQTAKLEPVGRRTGRRSLGADVLLNDEVLFRVHFDGSDGKCQVRNLPVNKCAMLQEWDIKITD